MPTLASSPSSTPSFTDSEQVLLSLVLALSSPEHQATGAAVPSSGSRTAGELHGPLLAELRACGAQADLLLGGALVATVPHMQSARDQAALAARCAATVIDHWPAARVAVVTGRGSRSRGLLTGEVIDRAWKLLGRVADPSDSVEERSTGEILIDAVSAGLLETRFELRPTPSDGFALGSERLDEDTARLLLGKPTPCVGRERELAALEATFCECRDEQVARAVLVLAPPGLGKSRLRHEFMRRLEARGAPATILIGRGDPLRSKSSYGLMGEALRGQCGIRQGQDSAQQQGLLRDWIGRHLSGNRSQQVTAFLGELCGVLFSDAINPPLRAARQDPRIMSDQVEQAWLDLLRALAQEQPVLLILEDLHWADALTVKLVQAALRTLFDHPFMVLALARPEVQELYPNLWAGAVQAQPLHPLPKKAGERFVRQFLGPEAAGPLVARIVEQSAGNPLFLEELIRAAGERQAGELPETVAAMLQARIGGLEVDLRRALRAASIFGETFFENGVQSLLAATQGLEVPGALEQLVREEIVEAKRDRRFNAEPEYRFRHALMREAAYKLVSDEEAVAWHGAAGVFLEALGEEAVVLAEHFRLGQQPAQAVRFYCKAAEQSYETGDFESATLCAERGLACGAAGVERGFLLSIRATSAQWLDNYQDSLAFGPEAMSLLAQGSKPWCRTAASTFTASILCQRPDILAEYLGQFVATDPSSESLPYYICAAGDLISTLYMISQKDTGDMIRQRLGQLITLLSAQEYSAWAYVHCAHGVHHDLVLKLPYANWRRYHQSFEAARIADKRTLYAAMKSYSGRILFELGQWSEARKVLHDSLALAERIPGESHKTIARLHMSRLLASTAQAEDILEAERLSLLCSNTKMPVYLGISRGVLAQVALHRGDLQKAEVEARAACQILSHFPAFKPDIVALLSRILALQGNHAESVMVCEEALLEQGKVGIETYGLLDLYVTLAETRESAGLLNGARQAIERALPVLQRRVLDIPDEAMRVTYLNEIPENARLIELANQWNLALPWAATAG